MKRQSRRRMLVAARRRQRECDDVLRPARLAERDLHRIKKQLPRCKDTVGIGWNYDYCAYTLTLHGPLVEGRRLAKPLAVLCQWDGFCWVVSEPLFSNHAAGNTIPKAVAHFRRMFGGDFDFLDEYRGMMSQWLEDELEYMRSMIIDEAKQ